jgi:CIC family chloride channel protein
MQRRVQKVLPDTNATEALRLLLEQDSEPMLLAVQTRDKVVGVVTKTNILQALQLRRDSMAKAAESSLVSFGGEVF